ncbi:glycosyltransferase family 2 protein [Cryobacterium sp. M96]|uniref:glycosyltransferase family 2 protein n=1 Tax=Cryobacterium sp. M96 TaxID=2048295 RepID=UPI000CE514B6|nr:glycosyltransferase [Cryobacterium sp. M96]
MRFHVIIACHNRRALTIRSVIKAQETADAAGIEVDFTVFDDGSRDGTSNALSALRHTVLILKGDGSAFWAKSMALAEQQVLTSTEGGDDEYIVWLNDDVDIDLKAFEDLLPTLNEHRGAVVVGAMRDPDTSKITYSGMRRNGRHPLNLALIMPTAQSQLVDTFNGNLVAVPVEAARVVGGIDGEFSHAFADIDYGFRCQRLGIDVVLAPGTYGACPRNAPPLRGSIRGDWRAFTGAKGGGNYHSLRRILRKSNAWTWWSVIMISYGLWLTRRVLRAG